MWQRSLSLIQSPAKVRLCLLFFFDGFRLKGILDAQAKIRAKLLYTRIPGSGAVNTRGEPINLVRRKACLPSYFMVRFSDVRQGVKERF